MSDKSKTTDTSATGAKRNREDEEMAEAAGAPALCLFNDADLFLEEEEEEVAAAIKAARTQDSSETRGDNFNPNLAHESDAHPSGVMPSGNEYLPKGNEQRLAESGNAQYMRHHTQRQHSSGRSDQGESRERFHQWSHEQEWAADPFPSGYYPSAQGFQPRGQFGKGEMHFMQVPHYQQRGGNPSIKTSKIGGTPRPPPNAHQRDAHPSGDMPQGNQSQPAEMAWLVVQSQVQGNANKIGSYDEMLLSIRQAAQTMGIEISTTVKVDQDRKRIRILINKEDAKKIAALTPFISITNKEGIELEVDKVRFENVTKEGTLKASSKELEGSVHLFLTPPSSLTGTAQVLQDDNIIHAFDMHKLEVVSITYPKIKEGGGLVISQVDVNVIPRENPDQLSIYHWSGIHHIFIKTVIDTDADGNTVASGRNIHVIVRTDATTADRLGVCPKCLKPSVGKCGCTDLKSEREAERGDPGKHG